MAEGGSFAVVGGYGLLGRLSARLLIRDGARAVTIAGRCIEKAAQTAKGIAPAPGLVDVKGVRVDAQNADDLATLLSTHDVLLFAAPMNDAVSHALRDALLRIGGRAIISSHNPSSFDDLLSAHDGLKRKGARAIMDVGADPGLPALVGHLAAKAHGAASAVEISARYRGNKISQAGLADMLDSATVAGRVYENGWRRAGFFEMRWTSYPGNLGSSVAVPLWLPELEALRKRHDLEGLALWHGGLNSLADSVIFLRRLSGRLLPEDVFLKALEACVKHFNKAPFGLGVAAVASGNGFSRRVEISFDDGYDATAEVAALSAGLLAKDLPHDPCVFFAFEQLALDAPIANLRARGFEVGLT